jgi:hypothetical protein
MRPCLSNCRQDAELVLARVPIKADIVRGGFIRIAASVMTAFNRSSPEGDRRLQLNISNADQPTP